MFSTFRFFPILWKSKFHMCLIAAIAHSFLAAFLVVPIRKNKYYLYFSNYISLKQHSKYLG